jgi:hypothetical protein
MMNLSTRFLPLFGLLLITVFAVSCAQSGVGDGIVPTSPSSLSVAPSAAALGPGDSYNANGMWHFVVADVHGNVDETFDAKVSQDGNGNLSFVEPDGGLLISLERLGTGVIIAYRLSFTVDEDDCDILIQGTGRLDTRTNTMTVNLNLRELGCSNEVGHQVVTATKLS